MKKKTNKILLSISIALLILFASIIIYSVATQDEFSFYDEELGLVTLRTKMPIFEQVTFKRTTATIGQSVEMCDQIPAISSTQKFSEYKIEIRRDGVIHSNINILGWAERNVGKEYCMTFTPLLNGVYTARGASTACTHNNGWVCETRDKAANSGNTYWCPNWGAAGYTVGGIQICKNNLCNIVIDCRSYITSTATLIVSPQAYTQPPATQPQTCPSTYRKDWITTDTIYGGTIKRQDTISYKPITCEEYVSSSSYQTVCYDNFVVEGTSNTIASGVKKCVPRTTTPISSPTDDGWKPPVECNSDMTERCEDGSIIIAKTCIFGNFIDTDQKCPEIKYIEESEYVQSPTTSPTPVHVNIPSAETEKTINLVDILIYLTLAVIMVLIVVLSVKLVKRKKR